MALLKTKIGLKFTDKVVKKFEKPSRYLGYFCIGLAVISMAFMIFSLGSYIISRLSTPTEILGPAVAFILPFKVQGAIYVPLVFWLLSVLILATIHEFGHALIARANHLEIKNTGPAFFGIILPLIPAAYVEPDEKELEKRSKVQQLSVFSAGAAFNVITGLLFFIVLLFLFVPATGNVLEYDGLKIESIYAQELRDVGIKEGEIIKQIVTGTFPNPSKPEIISGGGLVFYINTKEDLTNSLLKLPPGILVKITTDRGEYGYTLIPHPTNPQKSTLGASLIQHQSFKENDVKKYGIVSLTVLKWFHELFVWLAILSLGIGAFNLLPMLPLDGGRMVKSALQGIKFGKEIIYGVSFLFLGVLIILFLI